MQLSAVVLAKNVEIIKNLSIASLSFCDEIVLVVDSTSKSAEEDFLPKNIRVIHRSLDGNFSEQRNFGMQHAKGEWILFVDTDEEVTKELQKEIQHVVTSNIKEQNQEKEPHYAYYIKRRDIFWNKTLRFGEVLEARRNGYIRLVKRDSGSWVGKVHETFVPALHITTGTLRSYLLHTAHQGVADFLTSINQYSSMRAQELKEMGKPFSKLELCLYPPFKFFYTYVILLGFLDGAPGFVYSFMMSFHSFLVRAKLFQLTKLA